MVVCSAELIYPFGRDQGNYAYPAWVWLQGETLYRDVYVFKPPATVWVHALAQVLFGHSMLAIRLLDVGWTAATSLAIAAIARRLSSAPAFPVVAGGLYAFLYANFDFWNTCQTDGWLNLPVSAALLLALRVREGAARHGWLVLAGALLGLAALFKYTALAMALPLGLLALAEARQARTAARLAVWGGLGGLGLAVVFGATALWLQTSGALPAFLESQLGLVPAYVARTGRASGLLGTLGVLAERCTSLLQLRYLAVLALAGAATYAWRARAEPRFWLALAWLAGGLASTVAQNKFFRYHFLTVVPGAALLGAFAICTLVAAAGRRSRTLALAVALATLAVLVVPSKFPPRWAVGARMLAGTETTETYWSDPGFSVNQMSVAEVMACAKRVDALTTPDDRVFVWGFDPVINYVAARRTVSRFLYNYPFAVAWGDQGYKTELLDALRANPPAVFVVASKDATPQVTGNEMDSRELFLAFPELRAFVAERYGEPETVARYTLYRRKPT